MNVITDHFTSSRDRETASVSLSSTYLGAAVEMVKPGVFHKVVTGTEEKTSLIFFPDFLYQFSPISIAND